MSLQSRLSDLRGLVSGTSLVLRSAARLGTDRADYLMKSFVCKEVEYLRAELKQHNKQQQTSSDQQGDTTKSTSSPPPGWSTPLEQIDAVGRKAHAFWTQTNILLGSDAIRKRMKANFSPPTRQFHITSSSCNSDKTTIDQPTQKAHPERIVLKDAAATATPLKLKYHVNEIYFCSCHSRRLSFNDQFTRSTRAKVEQLGQREQSAGHTHQSPRQLRQPGGRSERGRTQRAHTSHARSLESGAE